MKKPPVPGATVVVEVVVLAVVVVVVEVEVVEEEGALVVGEPVVDPSPNPVRKAVSRGNLPCPQTPT